MLLDAALFCRRPQSVPATLDFHPSPSPFSLRPARRGRITAFGSLCTLSPPSLALSCSLLQKSECHPFYLQPFARSLQKRRRCHHNRFSNSSILRSAASSPATPLDATLTDDLRVGFQGLYLQTLSQQTTEISRNRPPVTPVDATLTDFAPVTPLSATLTKIGGRGCQSSRPPQEFLISRRRPVATS